MPLSNDLTSLFAKEITKPEKSAKKAETTLNATVVNSSGNLYVKIDGSDQLTPIITTTTIKDGERVTVMIKNHSAIVTGNISSPAPSQGDLDDLGDKIAEFDTVIADVVHTDDLTAIYADIENLTADNVTIRDQLTAANANIDKLEANDVTINGKLTAAEGEIDDLYANMLTVEVADLKYATIGDLEVTNADIHNLQADYGDFKVLTTGKFDAIDANIEDLTANQITVDDLDAKYANIDFANIGEAAFKKIFADSGVIGDLVMQEGHVTGTLVGVTIKGDLIEGGTVVADKLVIKGTDGLYYKLNTDGETTSAEQTEYNSLNGSVITAQSITAEKINVSDLVAFNATIGGYHITNTSLYSGVKESVSNTTRGVYMDRDGQFALGDASNYLRYFKDTDGTYKLAISANAISIGAAQKDLEEIIDEVNDKVDNIDISNLDVEIGGRNLVLDSDVENKIEALNGFIEYAVSDFGQTLMKVGERFVIGFDAMSTVADVGIDSGLYAESRAHDPADRIFLTTDWVRYTVKVKLTSDNVTKVMFTASEFSGTGDFAVSIKNVKVERGTVATDWTPAPEDMATSDSVEDVQQAANDANAAATDANNRVTEAESRLEILSNSISSLVTDENGTSLMEQTSDGWTFNIGSIQTAISDAAEKISSVGSDLDQAEQVINETKSLVEALDQKTAYIQMSQDEEGNPLLILGRTDNDFRVQISNTSVDFMQGSSRVAYVSNRSLYIETAVIKNELRIGEAPGFIWKTRDNGNMGLRWEA